MMASAKNIRELKALKYPILVRKYMRCSDKNKQFFFKEDESAVNVQRAVLSPTKQDLKAAVNYYS